MVLFLVAAEGLHVRANDLTVPFFTCGATVSFSAVELEELHPGETAV
jgi:hypothetical protein